MVPEDIPFITTVINKLVREALESLESTVISLCKPDLTVELENLSAFELIGFCCERGQISALSY